MILINLEFTAYNEREFVVLLPIQPKCKSEWKSLLLLRKWIIAAIILSSFQLMMVLSERIVASHWRHVACCFHPLEGLLNSHKTYQQRIKALYLPEFFGSSLVSPCWKKKLKAEYASSLARKIAKTFIHMQDSWI